MSKQHLCYVQLVLQLDQHLLHQEGAFSFTWDRAGGRHKMQTCFLMICSVYVLPVKGK